MKRLPISARLIRGIHERLLRDVRGADQYPGEFRTIQNFIGRSQDPHEARFVPPPPGRVVDLIADLERYIHRPLEERRLARLARLALIHYQFETIHPFRDGNGRVGRILIPLLLQQDDPSDPPLYLSAFFERHRQQYYDLMLAVSQRGAYAKWIGFFLEAVVESAQSSVELAHRLIALRATYYRVAQEKRWPAACLVLIDALFEHPVLTIKRVEERISVTTPTASAHLKKLEEAGMITEFTGRQRSRKYLALELLRLTHPSV
jgi:Fic family protein